MNIPGSFSQLISKTPNVNSCGVGSRHIRTYVISIPRLSTSEVDEDPPSLENAMEIGSDEAKGCSYTRESVHSAGDCASFQ